MKHDNVHMSMVLPDILFSKSLSLEKLLSSGSPSSSWIIKTDLNYIHVHANPFYEVLLFIKMIPETKNKNKL